MNKLAFGLTGAAALCVSLCHAASAADLAVQAAPPAVIAPTWTGFYVGGNLGAGWALPNTGFPPTNSGSFGNAGFIGGVQGGYNYQWSGVVVFGVEVDGDWSDVSVPHACFSCTAKIEAFGDVGGRAGVVLDKALIYVKGGWAWAEMKATSPASFPPFFGPGTGSASVSTWMNGAFLGAGVEYAFLPNWSAKVEYDYYEFGAKPIFLPVTVGTFGVTSNVTEQVVKFGLNYKFGAY